MKTILVTMMAATIFSAETFAETPELTELLTRIEGLTTVSYPSPREVADAIEAAKVATPSPWKEGDDLTYDQKFQNKMIASTAELMARKVSFNTALDYATQHQAWHLAYPWADRLDKRDLAIECAEKWVAASPTSPTRRAALLHLRAKYGQDVRSEVEAILSASDDLDHLTAWRLALAWQRSAQKAGPLNQTSFHAMLATAIQSSRNDHKLAVQVSTILMRAQIGENMNGPIMSLLADIQGTLPHHQATALFDAFTPTTATNEETLAFYDALLRSVEANAKSASFLRKILDQKLKLQ